VVMAEDRLGAAAREETFRADVAAMKVRGGVVARERLLARLGVALLAVGVGGIAYLLSSGTENPLQQRDAIVVALAGVAVAVAVAGGVVFLRYSLGALLRLWLARLVLDREE
jgi:hypothetical protein